MAALPPNGEQDAVQIARRQFREPFGQGVARQAVAVLVEVSQRAHLLVNRLTDLLVGVPEKERPALRGAVNVALAVQVIEAHAVPAGKADAVLPAAKHRVFFILLKCALIDGIDFFECLVHSESFRLI